MLEKINSLEDFLNNVGVTADKSSPITLKFPCEVGDANKMFPCNFSDDPFIEELYKDSKPINIGDRGPHPQMNWVDIIEELKKAIDVNNKKDFDALNKFFKSGEDIVLNPKMHYNITDELDQHGNIVYREIIVPVVGLSSDEVDVCINDVTKDSFVVSVNGKSKETLSSDYGKYVDDIKKGKKAKKKIVKQSFTATTEFILNITVNGDMDPNTVKCFYDNSILKIIIKPKPVQKQSSKRVRIDVIN